MDAGKASHYDEAARWLARSRPAYEATGRKSDWLRYLDGLLETHARKYKLVPMLRGLRR